MKNIVVSCDGTWNTPDENKGGVPSPTNVVKLHNALINDGVTQLAYYHPGVGTGKGLRDRVLGGGIGEGLDDNIKSAYNWLARHYRPGDHIYFFGFSRGAYTARSAAGFITKYGLLDLSSDAIDAQAAWQRVQEVFDAYRGKQSFANPNKYPFYNAQAGADPKATTLIYFIGVWDTVGALGIPTDFALLGLLDDRTKYTFHNTNLSESVAFARHAIAIDERRASFAPTLWTDWNEAKTDVKQLWFPGCHSDVGGGYVETGLSDGALEWMMTEAVDCGLKDRDGAAAQLKPDPLGILHNSCSGVFGVLKSQPRSVPRLTAGAENLHTSVGARLANPPLSQGDFWKTKVLASGESATRDVFANQRWNQTNIFLEKDVAYQFEATGEWLDKNDKFSPDGVAKGGFSLGDAMRHLSDVVGDLEVVFNAIRKSKDYDFWYTRRIQDLNWFALIGFIANDLDENSDGLPEGEIFLIGSGTTFTPKQDGYLYGFANDAWQAYGNNRGSVALTVSRA